MAHETTVRVRYGEVDRMGFLYHPHYLPYFEIGRTEFLRSLGRAYLSVEEAGILLVVAEATLKFRRPARYDDVLCIRTRLASVTGVRILFEYEIDRPADHVRCATGTTTLAATDRTGRPMRLPDEMRSILEAVVEGPTSAGRAATDDGSGRDLPGKPRAAAAVQGRSPS